MGNVSFAQEVVVVLAPFPNNPNPVAEFDVVRDFDVNGDGLVWYARPQLIFNCALCIRGCQGPEYSADHKEVSLVYFSTFEPINLTPNRVMQKAGVPMLYDTASKLQQSPIAQPIYMPSGKCIGASPPHSLLHRWQHPSDYSLQVQEQPNPGIGIRRYPAGSRELQQTVRGESLAVALRTRPAPDDVHRRGRGCQAGSNQRGKEKGRRDQ